MADYIEAIEVTTEYIEIKFINTLKASSITSNKFTLTATNSATPGVVPAPFLDINLSEHYNSISKILYLYFKVNTLLPSIIYDFKISGLQNAAGVTLPNFTHRFITGTSVAQIEDNLPEPATPDIEVDDKSLKTTVFTGAVAIVPVKPKFFIDETDPIDGAFYLAKNHNNGVLTIKFSAAPKTEFLTTTYFKAERRAIKTGPSRWESVSAAVVADVTNPWVHVRFPSNDATPVYNTAGKTYFENNYKYRVRISKEVGI